MKKNVKVIYYMGVFYFQQNNKQACRRPKSTATPPRKGAHSPDRKWMFRDQVNTDYSTV